MQPHELFWIRVPIYQRDLDRNTSPLESKAKLAGVHTGARTSNCKNWTDICKFLILACYSEQAKFIYNPAVSMSWQRKRSCSVLSNCQLACKMQAEQFKGREYSLPTCKRGGWTIDSSPVQKTITLGCFPDQLSNSRFWHYLVSNQFGSLKDSDPAARTIVVGDNRCLPSKAADSLITELLAETEILTLLLWARLHLE